VQSSIRDGGGTGLHLYPRKAWRWPYGCDRGDRLELQWHRDWLWYETWARYAWNADRGPEGEKAYWTGRLAEHFGAAAAPYVLRAYEESADVLPAIQRLVWLGNDNHTVVSAGAKLDQLSQAAGVPFLSLPGVVRIPQWLEAVKQNRRVEGQTPPDFLSRRLAEAEMACRSAALGARAATANKLEAEQIASDMQAVRWVVKFYRDKLQAAAEQARAAGEGKTGRTDGCHRWLEASVMDFRRLTSLTRRTYESMSDVPAWNPTRDLPCPYHWSDVLPIYEQELSP
jgi:hypothetical protein